MAQRSVKHATFVVERVYNASPARVFAAWADPAAKARWFAGPEEWGPVEYRFDFRVGGRESNRGGPRGGPVHRFESLYQDIVPAERIIYSYEMYVDDALLSVSLATVELAPEGGGTRLVLTEQGAFLDGDDAPALRERGTVDLLEALALEVERTPSA